MSRTSEAKDLRLSAPNKSTVIAKTLIAVAALISLALSPSRSAAQTDPAVQRAQTLTGCVQRGEAVTAYKLVNKDGIWNLGGSAKLGIGKQVDHTVKVTGKVIEAYDAKAGDLKGRDPKLRGIFNVSKITPINGTCTANQF